MEVKTPRPRLRRAAAAAAFASGLDDGASLSGPVEASIMLANDEIMRGLNRDYRGIDDATNVLSFANLDLNGPPLAGVPLLLGE